MEDIEEAIDRVTMGLERKGMVISPKEKEKIAYHEAGTCHNEPDGAGLRRPP
jgi:cell division protease FtsH